MINKNKNTLTLTTRRYMYVCVYLFLHTSKRVPWCASEAMKQNKKKKEEENNTYTHKKRMQTRKTRKEKKKKKKQRHLRRSECGDGAWATTPATAAQAGTSQCWAALSRLHRKKRAREKIAVRTNQSKANVQVWWCDCERGLVWHCVQRA